jgi:hypothetical protein
MYICCFIPRQGIELLLACLGLDLGFLELGSLYVAEVSLELAM